MIFATLSKTVTEKTSEKMLFKFSDLSKSLEYVKIWSNLLPFSKSVKMISWSNLLPFSKSVKMIFWSNLLPFSKSVKMIFWSNLLTWASVQNYQFGAVYSWAKNIGNIVLDQIYYPVQSCGEMIIQSTLLNWVKIWENYYFGYICFPG